MSGVEKLTAELRAALRFDDGRYLGHCGSDNILALLDAIEKLEKENEALRAALVAKPDSDWHEGHGYVVWWTWKDGDWLGEPAYIGSPLCDDWPGYHTHWTPHPPFPTSTPSGGDHG